MGKLLGEQKNPVNVGPQNSRASFTSLSLELLTCANSACR